MDEETKKIFLKARNHTLFHNGSGLEKTEEGDYRRRRTE